MPPNILKSCAFDGAKDEVLFDVFAVEKMETRSGWWIRCDYAKIRRQAPIEWRSGAEKTQRGDGQNDENENYLKSSRIDWSCVHSLAPRSCHFTIILIMNEQRNKLVASYVNKILSRRRFNGVTVDGFQVQECGLSDYEEYLESLTCSSSSVTKQKCPSLIHLIIPCRLSGWTRAKNLVFIQIQKLEVIPLLRNEDNSSRSEV